MRKVRKKISRKQKSKKVKRIKAGEFIDREFSMLEFNRRVLEQALDKNLPLLERVRFLTIFHSNLDEFFMKRVEASKRVKIYSVTEESGEDKVYNYDQYKLIRKQVLGLISVAEECYAKDLLPLLKSHGMHLIKWEELSSKELQIVNDMFDNKIFPILTPLAVDPGHPFPHISNLSTSLAVSLRYPGRSELFFARVKIPKVFPEWVLVTPKNNQELRWISLREIIERNLDKLFPNMEIVATLPFRTTRNIELEPEEEEADDILEMMEQILKERKFGNVVKLEIPKNPDPWLLRFLTAELELSEDDIYELHELLDYSSLNTIADIDIADYHFKPWSPVVPKALADDPISIFHCLSEGDILVHHPYESFGASVENFIISAVNDPNVLAIKMTLYRTNENSRLIRSLMRAAEAGKTVVCLIELKARLDEARNISWAQKLEEAGVHIVYGIVGLKTHCKVALVVKQEDPGIKSYCHIGTGNYNSQTAKLYTDLGLMTSNESITKEVVELFHHITGRSQKREYKNLLVAPNNMKLQFIEKILNEAKNARDGKPAYIIAKCNGLEDQEIIQALYTASKSGVKIDLIIRGICTLRPNQKDLSENIRVISIVDRFLEHSRIYYFADGQEDPCQGQFFMGSADWMSRNLERRIEVCTPIFDLNLKKEIFYFLSTLIGDRVQAWELNSDGSYARLKSNATSKTISAQAQLMEYYLEHSKLK
ncbi:MAG: polyphosphate kinase 1 [Bdellovibrionales bacterium]|nr:polyphosphate kinase 1 [Bdellovibrionales bacterium]